MYPIEIENKIKKFNKHVTDSGEKFVMSYDDRIGTFLEPVEIVDEGVLSNVRKAVEKTKKTLKKKWAKKGGYENFGQDEIRDLEDKYDYHSMVYGTPEERNAAKLIDGLDQWAMNYVGESVNEACKFGKKNQYSIDDVNEVYGFWGTLEAGGFKVREIEDCWHSAMAWLTESYKFSDAGALYYLNAKAGRWVADQVIENKGHKDVVDVLEDYATPNEWKKWSKEYNKYAQEEIMQEAANPVNEEDDKDKKSTDRGPLDDDKIETALKKKALDI